MYDDHKLRQCAADTCCSAYFNDLESFGSSSFKPGGGGGGPPRAGTFDDLFGPSPGDKGPTSGGGGGPISGGEGGCAVDIDGPGTFIGTFQPWGHKDTPAAEAQLLSKRRRDPSSAPLSLSSTFSVPGERLVFRGRFVPDLETSVLHPPSSTLAPLPAKTRLSSLEVGSNSVLHDELATQTTIAQPAISKGAGVSKESRAPGGSHILWLNRDSDEDLPLKARDPEARVGGPGGPGGKKAP